MSGAVTSVRVSTMDLLIATMRHGRDRETISVAFRAVQAIEEQLLAVEAGQQQVPGAPQVPC